MKVPSYLFSVLSALLVFVAPAKLPAQVTVDYSKDESLLPLFQAGLHPRQERSLERMVCVLPKQQTLIFDFGEVKLPPVKADWSFDVQGDDRLTHFEGRLNRALTREEAIEIATGLNEALHAPVEPMIDFVKRYPESSPGAQVYRANVKLKNGVRVGYYFQHRFRDDKPLSIVVRVEWMRPMREFQPRMQPIKPPPGYEHISMEPEDAPLNAIDKVLENSSNPSTQKVIPKTKEKPVGLPETESRSWPVWLFMVIVATAGALWLLLRKRK